ncbi:MAG: hypothetical protein QXN21_03375 [Candidatus Bathyarchaeia archaeon]
MSIVLLAAVILSSISIALASEPSIKVSVYAKAKDCDIIVIGKVFLSGLESGKKVTVSIAVTVKKPDGSAERATFRITGLSDSNGVTILPYEYVFKDCVNKKGIYEIEVIATYNKLTDRAFFKFDPPTGGTPGVPF